MATEAGMSFLPQLDRLDGAGARALYELISPAFDMEEQPTLRRVIRNLLGTDSNAAMAGDAPPLQRQWVDPLRETRLRAS